VLSKLQPSAAAQNDQPMASRSTHDQLMRKPITIEHHALVKYIQNDEQSLVLSMKFFGEDLHNLKIEMQASS